MESGNPTDPIESDTIQQTNTNGVQIEAEKQTSVETPASTAEGRDCMMSESLSKADQNLASVPQEKHDLEEGEHSVNLSDSSAPTSSASSGQQQDEHIAANVLGTASGSPRRPTHSQAFDRPEHTPRVHIADWQPTVDRLLQLGYPPAASPWSVTREDLHPQLVLGASSFRISLLQWLILSVESAALGLSSDNTFTGDEYRTLAITEALQLFGLGELAKPATVRGCVSFENAEELTSSRQLLDALIGLVEMHTRFGSGRETLSLELEKRGRLMDVAIAPAYTALFREPVHVVPRERIRDLPPAQRSLSDLDSARLHLEELREELASLRVRHRHVLTETLQQKTKVTNDLGVTTPCSEIDLPPLTVGESRLASEMQRFSKQLEQFAQFMDGLRPLLERTERTNAEERAQQRRTSEALEREVMYTRTAITTLEQHLMKLSRIQADIRQIVGMGVSFGRSATHETAQQQLIRQSVETASKLTTILSDCLVRSRHC
mmetsp:Transcript_3860/g.11854  ORF Transcript_3860/g.11854 Transcript_3860/m.11854 type:complete len:492 (-) Transcript_3860:280-1755(-)|eukprot:CAMPEP_0174230802 /NCGR_PEP_ID=MMETSP0417-20130205/1480_1 /TAXON_ID=242541 /ORGANISM="Mayorella sp, Strain BSH-02190019" /LENGTH=491 /DNA_ID=CAMNT_0015308563 /DNA_START=140 /DNA_END=1615 /DNA_ORIENTATION=+